MPQPPLSQIEGLKLRRLATGLDGAVVRTGGEVARPVCGFNLNRKDPS